MTDGRAEWAFRRHYGDIYRYLLRRTGDPDVAEELTQRVFVDAVTGLEDEQKSPVLAWLYTVAKRRLADEERSEVRRRRRSGLLGARIRSAADKPDDPSLAQDLREAIAALEPEAREVVVLKLLEGRSFAEIAATSGVSVGAARMRLLRALRILRAELERRGIEP